MRAELVCRALTMVQGQRNPAAGVLLHSDRGSQYASAEYQALLKKHKMVCSMSRKGNGWENQRSAVSRAVGERAQPGTTRQWSASS